MVDASEARKDLLDCALIGNIHDDRVHLPQIPLGLKELVLGAPGDRDRRAFVPGRACGGQADPTAPADHKHVSTF